MICISSHPQIRQRAYEIFQERLLTGRKGDALSDWLEAEYQIHRQRVPAQASMLHLHPKPATVPRNVQKLDLLEPSERTAHRLTWL